MYLSAYYNAAGAESLLQSLKFFILPEAGSNWRQALTIQVHVADVVSLRNKTPSLEVAGHENLV